MTQKAAAMVLMFILYEECTTCSRHIPRELSRREETGLSLKCLNIRPCRSWVIFREKALPPEVKQKLDSINDKGEKPKMLYGDTNNDGVSLMIQMRSPKLIS